MYAALSADFAATPAGVSKHVPVRQLAAFEKVFVTAGATKTVTMVFVPAKLAGWNLFHGEEVTLHLAVGDVSPTASTLQSMQTVSIKVAEV